MSKQKSNQKSKLAHSVVSGPTRTRRFGNAIKILLPTPHCGKCTWNCIYCPMRESRAVKKELNAKIYKKLNSDFEKVIKKYPKINSVVISGSTEPTLHEIFPQLIKDLVSFRKKQNGEWKIHCITNGSQLKKQKVKAACLKIDQLWVKFDCALETLFQSTNHPSRESGSLQDHLKNIKEMDNVCLHTTLWRFPDKNDLQNWNADNLKGLLEVYKNLHPSSLHLTTLKGKSLFTKLQPVSYTDLEAFALRVEELGIPVEVFA